MVDPVAIWEQFVDSAWSAAEPGALFWDRVTQNTPADIYSMMGFGSISTNPCVTGDTIIQTNAGPKTIKELADNSAEFRVRSYDKEKNEVVLKRATAFKTKDNAKILKLKTKSGKVIKLTPDHRVFTKRGWIEAKDLKLTDKVLSIK